MSNKNNVRNRVAPHRAQVNKVSIPRKEQEGRPVVPPAETESGEDDGRPVRGASMFKRLFKKDIHKAGEGREGIDW